MSVVWKEQRSECKEKEGRGEGSDGRGRVEEKVGVEGGKRVEQVDKGGNGRKRSRVGKDDGIIFRSIWPILVFREEGPNSS